MTIRFAFLLGVFSIALVGLSACGDSGAKQEELDKARKQGVAQARQQAKIKEIEKQLRALRRGGTNGPGSAPVSGTTDLSSCGGSLYVGPVTTCEFAGNVQSDYFNQIGSGSGTISSYSPATGRVYSMYCTAGTPHVCTGGNNASVYFP